MSSKNIYESVKALPDHAGIYQYFDANNRLLYIGKAKSLKKRVKSYFRFDEGLSPAPNLSPRIYKMIKETARLEYLLVENEHDALILENSLIKQLKPKYNILLRDDKTYPYIYIDLAQDFARFEVTRKLIKGSHIKYFGPFSSSHKAILEALYLLFPLVQKRGCLRDKKACLFYQINRCSAPCEAKISADEYAKIIQSAIELINDKKQMLKRLNDKMLQASKLLNYEEASRLRDMQTAIKNSMHISQIDLARLEDFDIFAVYIEGKKACALRLFIREGRVTSSTHTILNASEGFDKEELYERLLFEYYTPDIPYLAKNILCADELENQDIIMQALKERCNHNFNIQSPKIGDKKALCNLAVKNAKELLLLDKNETKTTLFESLQNLLELENTPFRIEVFDNSHLMGEASVGAMIVYESGKFIKSNYRHYHLHAKDEYSQMREILSERAKRFDKEPAPDLWLIDGGETLRSLAEDILQSVGVNTDAAAIAKEKIDAKAHRAKGSANDILYTKKGRLILSPHDERLQFLQRLRDEAHRFAIAFHRKTRQKRANENSALKAAGLNDAVIKKLIDYFGTYEATRGADEKTLNELFAKRTAKRVFAAINTKSS
ncbi:MAG: excinuclease ABC subunit UvrC [Campylobacteraceae bacterium]|jgi:excinuclease ABC subunit C|nr:excinuclease ABC subunit UvrC [Campylobacteraceae bacterium]